MLFKDLRKVPGIAIQRLGRRDVVRHSLVQRIIQAYGDVGERRAGRDDGAAEDGNGDTGPETSRDPG